MKYLTKYVLPILVLISVIALYMIRNEHNDEHRQLRMLADELAVAQATHQTMRAEWSSLNTPVRLARLAQKYLKLASPDIAQLALPPTAIIERARLPQNKIGRLR